jgi:hypothetical protein
VSGVDLSIKRNLNRKIFRKFLESFWNAHKRGALFENGEREFIKFAIKCQGIR